MKPLIKGKLMRITKISDKQLLEKLAELNFDDEVQWFIKDEKLTKNFKFSHFQSAFSFMTMCALYCEKIDHHPEWTNSFNQVDVQLSTHSAKGITSKDFELAEYMDNAFKHFSV